MGFFRRNFAVTSFDVMVLTLYFFDHLIRFAFDFNSDDFEMNSTKILRLELLKCIKVKKSLGFDFIHLKLVTVSADFLSKPLTIAISNS